MEIAVIMVIAMVFMLILIIVVQSKQPENGGENGGQNGNGGQEPPPSMSEYIAEVEKQKDVYIKRITDILYDVKRAADDYTNGKITKEELLHTVENADKRIEGLEKEFNRSGGIYGIRIDFYDDVMPLYATVFGARLNTGLKGAVRYYIRYNAKNPDANFNF